MLPFPECTPVFIMPSLFPFPIRELKEGQSQVRGLGLNSQHPNVTPASKFEMKLTEALKAEAIADGSSKKKLTSP